MQYKLAVFDMAGTTVSEGGAVYRALELTLEERGILVTSEAIHQVKGTDKREALRVLIEGSPLVEQLLPELSNLHERFVERMIEHYRTSPLVGEVAGTAATFRWLRERGVKVALNTGFSRQIAAVLIDRLGWERDRLIDGSITSDEVERGRPAPYMITKLMDRFGINDPSQVIKVGDAPSDLLEGYNASCGLVIGVLGGSSTREELQGLPHDHLIDTVADIPALLSTIPVLN